MVSRAALFCRGGFIPDTVGGEDGVVEAFAIEIEPERPIS